MCPIATKIPSIGVCEISFVLLLLIFTPSTLFAPKTSITFNLMLATISAIGFTGAFSIGANLVHTFLVTSESQKKHEAQKLSASKIFSVSVIAGFLSGLIITFAGNLHTIYLFFKPYQNENPVPFWQLLFSPTTFPNNYWYPNATRFIHNTIHEFPLYSYVVSDLHGHVLDIPFVLLTIAILLSLIFNFQFSIFNQIKNLKNSNSFQILNFKFQIVLLAFLLAIMYMTNAWDGIIYFLLSIIVLGTILFKNRTTDLQTKFKIVNSKRQKYIENILNLKSGFTVYNLLFTMLIFGTGFFMFSLPFNLNFKPFASGIGVLCAPKFLIDIGNFGPFIFESNHCQHSPLWQLFILYGFFYFWVMSFIVFLFKKNNSVIGSRFSVFGFKLIGQSVSLSDKLKTGKQISDNRQLKTDNRLPSSDIFVLILIIVSTLLIILPEFIYVKDIYPAHYRANTMFKLVYQSFIMLSIASAYIIIRLILNIKYQKLKIQIKNKIFNFYYVYLLFAILFFILVMLYPYFSINSYFNGLRKYEGLDGIKYLKSSYPNDYEAILWIDKNIKGQPIILEAQGDSYTDYGRVSANTGLPTVLGWAVHEWLWRGTYDIPSPRIDDVTKMYESEDLKETKTLLKKYNVSLVFLGDLERQKYTNLNEEKFKTLGKTIYQKGTTKIYGVKEL